MCNMKRTGRPSHLPSHTPPTAEFTRDQNFMVGRGFASSFTYIAPVVKYAPAHFQPGPVYYGGIATAIGHQPWNFSQVWTAFSTPKQMDWHYVPSYKGTQSAASYAMSQLTMAQLLQLRSVNSGR